MWGHNTAVPTRGARLAWVIGCIAQVAVAADAPTPVRDAPNAAVGEVVRVRTVYDEQANPTTVFALRVSRVARGEVAPGRTVELRVAGGMSRDGRYRVFSGEPPLHWSLIAPGVVGWFAWGPDGALADHREALVVRTVGKNGRECAVDGQGSVVVSVDPWRWELRFPDAGEEGRAVFDCRGAPPFDDVARALRDRATQAP